MTSELKSDLETKLAKLQRERMNIEMSDDRAFSNGRLTKIDEEIQLVKAAIAERDEK